MKRRNVGLAAIPFITGLITFISPLLVSAAIGDVPSYGLVGHWQFDTSTGTIALSGPGSPGNETTIFGLYTYRALRKFQAAHGLPSTGYFGPQTRSLVNALSTQ